MPSAPRILLIGEHSRDIGRLRLLLGTDLSAAADTCRQRVEASQLLRTTPYDVLIILANPAQERGIP